MPPSASDAPGALRIALIASEAVPFAKTGGLADVTGALSLALAGAGHDVRLFLPRYGSMDGHGLEEWKRLAVPTHAGDVPAVIERAVLTDTRQSSGRAEVMAVRYDRYFDRPGLYQEDGADYPDNLERFTFFCRAVMETFLDLEETAGWVPDVVHAHDWQAALAVVYSKSLYIDYTRRTGVASVLTIHNLGYQGIFPSTAFPITGLPSTYFTPMTLEFYGRCNLLKGGLIFADVLSTVSETYSREIQTPEFGFGLDGVIRQRRTLVTGVLNGIDTAAWDPATDPHLPANYSKEDLSGKSVCKAALQRERRLPVAAVPVIALISRLTSQKGLDLVAEILPELLEVDAQVVLLGTGDPALEDAFRSWQARHPRRVAVHIGFDEQLAHRLEAGADLFLMPSRYEPCGLNQLYSLRYGTVPVVRRTGGLADTVVSYTPRMLREGRANGFVFREAETDSLLTAVLLALRVYRDADEWRALMVAGMDRDVSWGHAARLYNDLYQAALNIARGQGARETKGG